MGTRLRGYDVVSVEHRATVAQPFNTVSAIAANLNTGYTVQPK